MIRAMENPAYTRARERAAQIWCEPQHSHKEMDVELAESIAKAIFETSDQIAGLKAAAGNVLSEATWMLRELIEKHGWTGMDDEQAALETLRVLLKEARR